MGAAIVIGQTIADSLFPGRTLLPTLRVSNLPFRVVGVMLVKGQDQQGRDQDDIAFIRTLQCRKNPGSPRLQVNSSGHFTGCNLHGTTADHGPSAPTAQSTANEPNDFTVRNMTHIAEAANETNTMTILLACIASVAACGRY